jgi:hypothetical protein
MFRPFFSRAALVAKGLESCTNSGILRLLGWLCC